MTSDFGVTAGHVEYSNRRFDFDTRHMVMIEVYRHSAALDRFDYERPVYDRNDSYRARLFLTDEEYKAVRRMELNGILRILHHANVVGGYLVDDRNFNNPIASGNAENGIRGKRANGIAETINDFLQGCKNLVSKAALSYLLPDL